MSIRNGHARWAFNLSGWKMNMSDLKIATTCIQDEEKHRIGKFVFQEDFKASLVGRLLMRKFVSQVTNIDYDQIKFSRDLKGKPYLIQDSATNQFIEFNISHQGSYAILAGFAGNKTDNLNAAPKIGVDLMKIEYTGGKPLKEFFRLMTRNFSNVEWNYIKSFSSDYCKLEAFMRHWSLKESYVKNVGVGITVDLEKISFCINTPELSTECVSSDTTLQVDGKNMSRWTFEESLIDSDHGAAVAIENLPDDPGYTPLPFETIDFHNLIKDWKPILAVDLTFCEQILNKDTKR